jgi:hypothetical protein
MVWPGFAYAYARTRYRSWGWWALAYSLPAIALTTANAGGPMHGALDDVRTVAMFILGGVGAVHLLSIREAFAWRQSARLRVETRERAQALCRDDPKRALAVGIGRRRGLPTPRLTG